MSKTATKLLAIAAVILVVLAFGRIFSASDAKTTSLQHPSSQQSSGYYIDPKSLMPKEKSNDEPVSQLQPSSSSKTEVSSKAEILPSASSKPESTVKLAPQPQPKEEPVKSVTVYVTETGEKYHTGGCQYLRKSKIAISLDDAKLSYSPCSKCSPPR